MKISTQKERRIKKIREKIKELRCIRLTVHKTPRHIYAQVFSYDGSKVLASASSLESFIKKELNSNVSNKVIIAKLVGSKLAKRVEGMGIKQLAFDRSGFKFHGRIKALADSVRENGIKC